MVRRHSDTPSDHKGIYARTFHDLLNEGIYLAPSAFEVSFLSTAHQDHHQEKFLAALEKCLRSFRATDAVPRRTSFVLMMINRSFLKLAIALSTWFFTICLLGIWWGRLALTQAQRIAELEKNLGLASDFADSHWHRTQRMLYWESGTFFLLLLASTVLLCWLYWRDARRSRGLQAFFASVTHELRTPLSSIRLQAESIADPLANRLNGQNHLIRRLLEDTIRLEAQVERTLELARVEGGGPVYTQPLLIKPWLDRFLASWTADYPNRVKLQSVIEDVSIRRRSHRHANHF